MIIAHAIPEQHENTYYVCQTEHDDSDNERPHGRTSASSSARRMSWAACEIHQPLRDRRQWVSRKAQPTLRPGAFTAAARALMAFGSIGLSTGSRHLSRLRGSISRLRRPFKNRTPKLSFGYGARKSAAGGGKSILSTSAFCGSTPTPTLPRGRAGEGAHLRRRHNST